MLIDFLEGRAPAANRIALELDRGQLGTTLITRSELLAGTNTARQLKHVGELLAALPCLPLDEPAADAAAEIRRTLERDVGTGMADSLMAGIGVVTHHGVSSPGTDAISNGSPRER